MGKEVSTFFLSHVFPWPELDTNQLLITRPDWNVSYLPWIFLTYSLGKEIIKNVCKWEAKLGRCWDRPSITFKWTDLFFILLLVKPGEQYHPTDHPVTN